MVGLGLGPRNDVVVIAEMRVMLCDERVVGDELVIVRGLSSGREARRERRGTGEDEQVLRCLALRVDAEPQT